MREELVNIIRNIQDQRKSGLLRSVVEISQEAILHASVTVTSKNPDFSFFFKDGELAFVICRGIIGGTPLSRVAYIGSVVNHQWMPSNASTITATDTELRTDALLKLMGADAYTVSPNAATVEIAQVADANVLKQLARCKTVFNEVMGTRAEAALAAISARYDPHTNVAAFTAACATQLEPLLGKATAVAMLKV
jgi:hypothetical protein